MKKNRYLFVALLIVALSVMIVYILLKFKAQPDGNSIPNFVFAKLNEKPYMRNNLPNGYKYLFLYFSPDCHFCTLEIEEIINNKEKFKTVFLVLVSPSPKSGLISYNRFLSDKELNFIILQDKKFAFPSFFGPSAIPTSILYDKRGKIMTKIQGGSSVKKLYENFEK